MTGHALPIVVRARHANDVADIERAAFADGYTVRHRAAVTALELLPPGGVDTITAISQVFRYPGVLYAEPAYTMTAADQPGDPLFASHQRRYLDPVHAPAAWDIETGDSSVIVAVLDTGIDIGHADLAGRIWTNGAETPENGIDDDDNGCIDDVHGCAFVNNAADGCITALDGEIKDDVGHGTFVAGVIAANADGLGIVGVARGVTIMPVKVLDCEGSGNSLDVAQAIVYAAKNGARVINISLGGAHNARILQEAVRVATDEYGALVVAASGNTGQDGVVYPAKYETTLAVGAASSSNPDARAAFSSSGPEVDVVAIGQDIVGTVPQESCRVFLPCVGGEPYGRGNGTSFAAPQVSGLVALILSRRPDMRPADVINLVRTSADPVPDGDRADWAGAGRINMLRALEPQFRIGAAGVAKN